MTKTAIGPSKVDLSAVLGGVDVGAGTELEAHVTPTVSHGGGTASSTVDIQVIGTHLPVRDSNGGVTATSANSGDLVTLAAHGLVSGDRVIFTGGGGAAEHVRGESYYVIKATVDTFTVAETFDLALAGTTLTISGDSTGTMTCTSHPDGRVAGITAGDTTANTLTVVGHQISTGDPVKFYSGADTLGGITDGLTYYAIRVDADTLSFQTTPALAAVGTGANLSSYSATNLAAIVYSPPTVMGSSGPLQQGQLSTLAHITFPLGQRFHDGYNDSPAPRQVYSHYLTSGTVTAGKFDVELVTSYHGGRSSHYPTGSTIL
tara:strand:- start:228 stop:1181 length:954 start_codon:yes stop_codon:yes gene_type:complete